jgi:hypothetical protein
VATRDRTAQPAIPARRSSAVEPAWGEALEFGRRETILRALRRLWELHPGPVTIIETGTLRNDSPQGRDGDGWSTVAWGWYASQVGGKVYTVDVDAGALAVCHRVTAPYAAVIEYVLADSVAFLEAWSSRVRDASRSPQPGAPAAPIPHSAFRTLHSQVHLLYLDSMDYFAHQREESETHHLAEAEAALPSLAWPALVLLDDTGPVGETRSPEAYTGKGAHAVPYLLERGFAPEWCEQGQVLLVRGASRHAGIRGRRKQ